MSRALYLKIFVFFVSMLPLAGLLYTTPSKIQAVASCQTSSSSQPNYCSCGGCWPCTADCESVYSQASQGMVLSCFTTCNGGSLETNCATWTSWGPCGGGYQERYCLTPDYINDMQIRLCQVTGPGSPTPTPGPTPPPGCDDSSPTAVTLSSPANGASLSSLSVALSWAATTGWGTGCPQDNKYNVYVDTTNPPTTLVATIDANIANPPTTTVFTAQPGTTYYWRVMTANGSQGAYSAVRSFTTQSSISGTVYIDNGNTCSTAVPSTLSGLTATVRGTGYTSAVSAVNGTYSFQAPLASYANLDLLGMPANYTCSTGCLQSCPTKPTVASQSSGNNFFIATQVAGWWQAEGASIYAGSSDTGITVKSQLPSASTELILPGDSGTPGALIRGSGTASLGLGVVSSDLWNTLSRYRGKRMDYSYFAAQMGVIKGQASDWAGDLNQQAYDEGRDFWYSLPASGTARVSSPWVVPAGEKFVVFVNGDLRIESNITVANGGFVAFVVNGNVTVSPSVTSMQGIFISSGNFVTESQYVAGTTNDSQLDVQGSVISWGSLTLARNLGIGNNSTAAEKFTYRPDLLVNMPEKMKVFAMQWQEVVAGTFE